MKLFFRNGDEYTIHQKYAVGSEVVSKKWYETMLCAICCGSVQ